MTKKRNFAEAVAYIRTSSAANVGADKDSENRQRAAIEGFALREGFVIVDEFNDAAVSGADPIETRPGFAALLDRMESNGVRTVIVEDPSRFARDLVTQELGILALIKRGVRVLTANGQDLTDSSDPSRKMMRQIAGSFADGVASLRTEKSQGEVEVTIPLLPPLVEALRVGPTAELAFICGSNGKPMTKESFGNAFREACRAAGVAKAAHGVRKIGATRAANNGATVSQLEAIFGWRGGRMASHYTQSADRRRLAREAINKMMG